MEKRARVRIDLRWLWAAQADRQAGLKRRSWSLWPRSSRSSCVEWLVVVISHARCFASSPLLAAVRTRSGRKTTAALNSIEGRASGAKVCFAFLRSSSPSIAHWERVSTAVNMIITIIVSAQQRATEQIGSCAIARADEKATQLSIHRSSLVSGASGAGARTN